MGIAEHWMVAIRTRHVDCYSIRINPFVSDCRLVHRECQEARMKQEDDIVGCVHMRGHYLASYATSILYGMYVQGTMQ